MDMQSHVQLTSNVWKINERFGLQRIRSMRADAEVRQLLLVHPAQLPDELGAALFHPFVVVPAHYLPISDAVHALRSQRAGGVQIGDDVCGGRRSRFDHLASTVLGPLLPWLGLLRLGVHLVECQFPGAEPIVGALPDLHHAAVLQMSVRVDQSGGEHPIPMPFTDGAVRRHFLLQRLQHPAAFTYMNHAVAMYGNCAIDDDGARHGDDEFGGIQCHIIDKLGIDGRPGVVGHILLAALCSVPCLWLSVGVLSVVFRESGQSPIVAVVLHGMAGSVSARLERAGGDALVGRCVKSDKRVIQCASMFQKICDGVGLYGEAQIHDLDWIAASHRVVHAIAVGD